MPTTKDADEDSEEDIAFAAVDFTGVDFELQGSASAYASEENSASISACKELDHRILFHTTSRSTCTGSTTATGTASTAATHYDVDTNKPNQVDCDEKDKGGACSDGSTSITTRWAHLLLEGRYLRILKEAHDNDDLDFSLQPVRCTSSATDTTIARFSYDLVRSVQQSATSEQNIAWYWLGIAALQLYLQLNYTGPSLEGSLENNDTDLRQQLSLLNQWDANAVLSQLVVDGEWPCQVCQAPFLLLVSRLIFLPLTSFHSEWMSMLNIIHDGKEIQTTPYTKDDMSLPGTKVWCLRAAVAHQRLLSDPSPTLWVELLPAFKVVLHQFCSAVSNESSKEDRLVAASITLEWGLAQHFFDRPGNGKLSFLKAKEYAGLHSQVVGCVGKRTKYQHEGKAQLKVIAKSSLFAQNNNDTVTPERDMLSRPISHPEDSALLEKVRFENDADNQVVPLTILDQCILLALCLDVKNTNPLDGLTGETMGAYVNLVLDYHVDFMIYSTALLERAWLEFESSHARERSLLQLQALADQHSNRLTLTQSTFDSIDENAAPPQDRLRYLHQIVYPPRHAMLLDLAERYAKMGIVTSAAEIFADIQEWDSVVECYRRAGKFTLAEKIVRERLETGPETPRMWAALGDITNDVSYYEKAVEISQGRYSAAFVALGKHYFDKGEMEKATEYYERALALRPLMPNVWFRLGTISMQLQNWKLALEAFSTVVQQEPEEAEAWANVAAIHMHNKQPLEAYPALNEALRYNRNNWRIWVGKLYTCLDLKKFDEAVQSCHVILDIQVQKGHKEDLVEEKCIRAIVNGTIQANRSAAEDHVALDSSQRSLTRVHELLVRISSTKTVTSNAWVWEILGNFNEELGQSDEVLDNLTKQYRALQSVDGWEKDEREVRKVVNVVTHIADIYHSRGTKDSLTKCRFLIRGALDKISLDHVPNVAAELQRLQEALQSNKEKLSVVS